MSITEGFNRPRAASISVVGFIRRHNRASIAAAVALGISPWPSGGPSMPGHGGRDTHPRPIHSHKEVIHHDDEPGTPIHLKEVGTTE